MPPQQDELVSDIDHDEPFFVGITSSWERDGNCTSKGIDVGIFFPSMELDGPTEYGRKKQLACAICATCPKRGECLGFAIQNNHRVDGIWGGHTQHERRAIRAKYLETGIVTAVNW